MDRTAGDAPSDVVVVDDTLYRRPSARPGTPPVPVARASFGLGDGPISPVRPTAAVGPPARKPEDEAGTEDPPPRSPRLRRAGIVVLSAVVLLAGTVAGVAYVVGPDKLASVLRIGARDVDRHVVTGPLDDRTAARLTVLAGANRVRVGVGELGTDLYRISTPDDAGIAPSPAIRDDDITLQVVRDGAGAGGEIEIVLAAGVRWSLRFAGYAEEQIVDVGDGQVSDITMAGGVRRAELTLPRPAGTVPVEIIGSVDELVLRAPPAGPVRVRIGGGADTVVAGARTLRDVPAGSTLTPRSWAAADRRYDVTAAAQLGSLTVEHT